MLNFGNVHSKALHAGMQSVTREIKGQLLVKCLGMNAFTTECLFRQNGTILASSGVYLLSLQALENLGAVIFYFQPPKCCFFVMSLSTPMSPSKKQFAD